MTNTIASTPDEVCEKAAELIEREGLHKRERWQYPSTPYPGHGPVCITGALMVASGLLTGVDRREHRGQVVYMTALDAVSVTVGHMLVGVFNDQRTTSAADAAALLRATARRLRVGQRS